LKITPRKPKPALKKWRYDEIQRHYARKAMLGSDYRERDTGTWRQAEAYMRREREKKGGSQLAPIEIS
jgi:hypothetical protein